MARGRRSDVLRHPRMTRIEHLRSFGLPYDALDCGHYQIKLPILKLVILGGGNVQGFNENPYWVRVAIGSAFIAAAVALNVNGSHILGLMAGIAAVGFLVPGRKPGGH